MIFNKHKAMVNDLIKIKDNMIYWRDYYRKKPDKTKEDYWSLGKFETYADIIEDLEWKSKFKYY